MSTKKIDDKPLYPVFASLKTLLIQVAAVACGLFLQRNFEMAALSLLVSMGCAFLLARLLKLSLPWQLTNLFIPALGALLLFSKITIPFWIISLVLIILLLIYIPTFWTRVPYYPTSAAMYERVLEQLPQQGNITFLDLGSGFGHLLFFLSKKRPDIHFCGVEISPLPHALASFRQRITGQSNLEFRYQDFWKLNFDEFDYVYAFLAPPPMERIWKKVEAELGPGKVFITNTFRVPAEADKVVEIDGKRQNALYIFYRS